MQEARSRYAILGMLSVAPMSGYDIKQAMETSVAHFWTLSYGQIYPLLKALAAEGLVARTVEESDGRPDRHVYTLTDSGHAALVRWLEEPVVPIPSRHELLLKLFFGREVPAAVHVTHVERLRGQVVEALARYEAIAALNAARGTPVERAYRGMTLRYGERMARAILGWCDETLETLRALPNGAPGAGPADPPGGAPGRPPDEPPAPGAAPRARRRAGRPAPGGG